MTMRVGLCIVILAATIAAPKAQDAASCRGTQKLRQVAEILFGRDVGRHVGVSEAAWAHFVARELTPRFPDGLTISDAKGQWRDSGTGPVRHEPTKRVEIVLPGSNADADKLDAVVKAYKDEFRQHSVLVIVHTACVSF